MDYSLLLVIEYNEQYIKNHPDECELMKDAKGKEYWEPIKEN